MRRLLPRIAIPVIVLALGASLALWGRGRPALARAPSRGGTSAAVAIAMVRDFTPRVLATGTIRLRAGARIEVGARTSGVVRRLAVTQGSEVRQGDTIAVLDRREATARLAEASARVEELEAASAQADSDLARVEALSHANGASRQDLLAARTGSATARARLAAARSDRDLAQVQLDYTVILAPIGGVVASVTTHEGETVAASFAAPTFVTLIDPTRLECIALVDETDIGRVRRADSADFTVDAYPGRVFRGRVIRIAPDATIVSGVVDYEVTVQPLEGIEVLKPQMTASVSIAGTSRRALVVPSAAVRQTPDGAYVWRLRAALPQRVAVVLGARQPDLTEVRGGLAAGDSVLTAGFPEEQ
ncbi:MAG TPA: efflux RND transporter periplasmic adaptor subunit [Gemmatimonadaceae bacterium]|nr:efflux RND transporter periplasmic adaptor subunit [Gemmatimonadaceae bacterium]